MIIVGTYIASRIRTFLLSGFFYINELRVMWAKQTGVAHELRRGGVPTHQLLLTISQLVVKRLSTTIIPEPSWIFV